MSAPARRLFTVAEYDAMGRAGIFAPDDRVELLEGEILTMSPIGPRHAGAVDSLNGVLARAVGDRAIVRVQNPIVLGDLSEPQPDLSLLRPREAGYRRAHPVKGDMLLAVEVADSTIRFDRERKLPLYARFEIPETWIVDLTTSRVDVHTDPRDGRYESSRTHERGEHIAPSAFPDIAVAVLDIVGPPED